MRAPGTKPGRRNLRAAAGTGALALLAAVALLAAACEDPLLAGPGTDPGTGIEAAVPRDLATPASLILDDSGSSYRYTFTLRDSAGAQTAPVTVVGASLPWLSPALPLGDWDIAVTVRDQSGTTGNLVASGATPDATVTAAVTNVIVGTTQATGTGTLSVGLTWTPADLAAGAAAVFMVLEPRPSGTVIPLDVVTAVDAGLSTYSGSVPSGSYLLRTGITLENKVVWGGARSVAIFPGLETATSLAIPDGTINDPPHAAPTVPGGAYPDGAYVRLAGDVGLADVYYTTDGSDPGSSATRIHYDNTESIIVFADVDSDLDGSVTIRVYAENRWGSSTGSWIFTKTDAVHVDGTGGDDGNPGTSAAPKATVGAALSAARVYGLPWTILVARGDYDEPAGLRIDGPYSLSGGWLPGFDPDTRDTTVHVTTITRAAPSGGASWDWPDATVYVDTWQTVSIDGIVIRNESSAGYTAGIQAQADALTVSDCAVDGGNGTELSAGVVSHWCSPSLVGNRSLTGGTGPTAIGFRCTGSTARPQVKANALVAGRSSGFGDRSVGILLQWGAGGVIKGNLVTGGPGSTESAGLYLEDVQDTRIVGNRIHAGDGTGTAYGLLVRSGSLRANGVVMAANAVVCIGGPALRFESTWTGGSSSPTVAGNTLYSSDGPAISLYAVGDGARTAIVLINNIVFGSGAGGRGLEEVAADAGIADPFRMENNDFYGLAAAYLDSTGTAYSLPEDLNTAALILQTGGVSAANAVIDPSAAFVGGALPIDFGSFKSFDWNLLATADPVLLAGGTEAVESMPDLYGLADLYGVQRTAPRSIGATERD